MRRYVHTLSACAVALGLVAALLGCVGLIYECPTPPTSQLTIGNTPASVSPPKSPGNQPASPQRVLIPGLSTDQETPAPPGRTQEYLPGVEVRIFAGTGQAGGLDGPRDEASFDGPLGLALGAPVEAPANSEAMNYLYITELDSGRIRIVDPAGTVWTWIGGSADARFRGGLDSPFLHPRGIAVGSRGEVYITDSRHGLTLVEDGRLVALSSGVAGFRDGPLAEAAFNVPGDVVIAQGNAICLTDTQNNRIRMLSAEGRVGTLAGSGSYGYRNGPSMEAEFTHRNGLAFDTRGSLYIADGGSIAPYEEGANAQIRVLSPAGQVSTYAGSSQAGYVDGSSSEARFNVPLLGLAFDGDANLYIADMNNHVVRVVTHDGRVLTVAGTGEYGQRGGSGAEAMLGLPADIVWDGRDTLFVTDYGQNVIWQIILPAGRANS